MSSPSSTTRYRVELTDAHIRRLLMDPEKFDPSDVQLNDDELAAVKEMMTEYERDKKRAEKLERRKQAQMETMDDDDEEENDDATPDDDDEEENDEATPKDSWAKHRTAIMNTIVSPEKLASETFDTLLGQDDAKEHVQRLVRKIQNLEQFNNKKLPSNLVFYGNAATGKSKMVRVMAGEAKCTLFKVPSRFFDKNIDRLPALFAIAKEKALETGRPSIVFLDECDGLFNKQNDAKINSLKATIENADELGNVIPIFTTNHLERLKAEGLVDSRLNNVITFKPLGFEDKQKLVELAFKSMETPHDVEISNWEPLRERLMGCDNRALKEWCKNVSDQVCDDKLIIQQGHKGYRNDTTIRLEDCIATTLGVRASTAPDDDALKVVVDEIKALCYSEEHDYNTQSAQNEPVVPVFEGLLPSLSDAALDALGPPGVLRRALDHKKKDVVKGPILDTLAKCIDRALPSSSLKAQNDCWRVHIKREQVFENGTCVGYQTLTTKAKCKGWMIQKCHFYRHLDSAAHDKERHDAENVPSVCRFLPPSADKFAYDIETIGGDKERVAELATLRDKWDADILEELIKCGALPPLHSVGQIIFEKEHPMIQCTFVEPNGTLVPDVWFPHSIVKAFYPSKVTHIDINALDKDK